MSNPNGVPGPARRLLRDRLLLGAVLVGTAISALAGRTASINTFRLQGTIDRNFRGAYDILVRSAQAKLGVEATGGLVERNFLGLSRSGGLTRADLATIRADPGVELAAPISVVGYLTSDGYTPSLVVPQRPTAPTLYDVRYTARTSDGTRSIAVAAGRGRLLVAGRGAAPGTDSSDMGGTTDLGSILSVDLPTLPAVQAELIAVDPTSERALLGPSAGFLDPLAALPRGRRSAATFPTRRIPADFAAEATSILSERSGSAAAVADQRPVIPMVVGRRLGSSLRLTVDITQIGRPLITAPNPGPVPAVLATAQRQAGPGRRPVGTSSIDVSGALRPFVTPSIEVPWPRSRTKLGASGGVTNTDFDARLPTRPGYDAVGPPGGGQFQVRPIGPARLGDGGDEQQTYRSLATYPLAAARGFVSADGGEGTDRPYYPAPLGSFDLGSLRLPTNPLNYAPLGAYDASATTVDRPGPGGPRRGTALRPSLNPGGLLTPGPGAITDIAGAEALRGRRAIDAVRVRVRGVRGATAEDRQRIEAVASRIATLGFSVDMVAGSSPRSVRIRVPGFYPGVRPARDLGVVREPWTSLGAAQQVSTGLGDADLWLVLLAAAAVAVGVSAVFSARRAAMAADEAVLYVAGWTRAQVWRWRTGPWALAALGVAAGGAAGYASTPRRTPTALLPAAVSVSVLIAVAVGETGAPNRLRPNWRSRLRRLAVRLVPARSRTGVAMRRMMLHPGATALAVASIATGATTAALGLAVAATAGRRAGPTLLGAAASADVRPGQVALVALSAVATLAASVLAARVAENAWRAERAMLSGAGWSSVDLDRTVTVEVAVTSAAGGAVAAALSAAAAGTVAPTGRGGPALVALVALVVATALGAARRRVARTGARHR